MWNSVWHIKDPFLSSHILGAFLCLNHLTRPCVNNYELQGFFPVWELTSQEYNRDLQAMNMTLHWKWTPFTRGGTIGTSFEPLWKTVLWNEKKKMRPSASLSETSHSWEIHILCPNQACSPKALRVQEGSTNGNHKHLARGQAEWLEAQTVASFSLSIASMTSQSRERAATNSPLEV